jgi:glycosyltransferase involved in cell wall biosynthesis
MAGGCGVSTVLEVASSSHALANHAARSPPTTLRPVPEIASVPAVTAENRPRWSVVIPVHNCADYLAQALPEVVAQLADRDDAEIIVVDDASGDDPAGVVERLGRGRVRYQPNPGHLGAIGTFNRCLELASGELVHLLHGDDAVLPGFYAAMEQALSDHAAVAAVCRVRDVDAHNTPLYITRSYRKGTGVWTDALDAFAVSNRVRTPAIVVRRAAYERVGGYRTDLPHAADWDMWTRLAAHGPIVFVDQVLAVYRRHEASDTSARVRTGANVRERVAAIGVLSGYVAPNRRARTTRRALAYSVVFASRTALSMVRAGEWSAAGTQLSEAIRCAWLLPRGLPVNAQSVPAPR